MVNGLDLVGVGLYTPAEAARLTAIPASKLVRWLNGHNAHGVHYTPLWRSQIDLEDGHTYLGFRDLMEARVADMLIKEGISAQRVRSAILLAQQIVNDERPLSTHQFKTDGRSIFLKTIEKGERGEEVERLLNLINKQYGFSSIISPLLKNVEADDNGAPARWWPAGRQGKIVVDPQRSFGQPIDYTSGIPTIILAEAAKYHGLKVAARDYEVSEASILRAVKFERIELKTAA